MKARVTVMLKSGVHATIAGVMLGFTPSVFGNYSALMRAWVDRGTDNNPPAGEKVVKLSNERFLPKEARFKGYKLDPEGNPTFTIQIGGQVLLDSWSAESGALVRKLRISGAPLDIGIPQPAGITVEGATGTTQKLTPGQPLTLTYRWKP